MDIKVYTNIQEEGRIFKVRLSSLVKVLFLFMFLFFFFVIGKFLLGAPMWLVIFVIFPPLFLLIYFRFFDKSVDTFVLEKKLSKRLGKKTIKAGYVEL